MNVASSGHPAGQLAFATPGNAGHLSRQAKAGRATQLARGIYVTGATLPREQVARYHRLELIAHYWPGAVVSDRSALEGAEPVAGWLFACHPDPRRKSDLVMPGLSISVRVGPGELPGDMPLSHGLFLSGVARGLVENVSAPGRPANDRPRRQAGTGAVEDRIDELARTGGAGKIASLLTELDVISSSLAPSPVEAVRRALAAVLGSFNGARPTSERLAARLIGTPFDQHRVEMFERFAELLLRLAPEPQHALGPAAHWQWLPFFESYFSNFIEGTEFGVEEARAIAIDGKIPSTRPQDAHDVVATFRLITDPDASNRTANSGDELIEMLREQHSVLLAARPDKRPGEFKELTNYAGGYQFVEPDLVAGTLLRGFNAFARVTDPFGRAAALMLLITEAHPFDDGNGRIARLIANASLSAAGQVRIVIPTGYRNDYLSGLSGVSNGAGRGETLVSVLRWAQRWTAAIDWSDYDKADAQLHLTNAYRDPVKAHLPAERIRMPTS